MQFCGQILICFRAILNLCMAYTSRDEITTAIESCIHSVQGSSDRFVSLNDMSWISYLKACYRTISERDIDSHLMTSSCPPLDILVRTSGVKRLSDFLLWQVFVSLSKSCIRVHSVHFSVARILRFSLRTRFGQSLDCSTSFPSSWIINGRSGVHLDTCYTGSVI